MSLLAATSNTICCCCCFYKTDKMTTHFWVKFEVFIKLKNVPTLDCSQESKAPWGKDPNFIRIDNPLFQYLQIRAHHSISRDSSRIWISLPVISRLLFVCRHHATADSSVPMWKLLSILSQARLWARGCGDVSSPSFGSHPNPISTRGGGEIMPTRDQ